MRTRKVSQPKETDLSKSILLLINRVLRRCPAFLFLRIETKKQGNGKSRFPVFCRKPRLPFVTRQPGLVFSGRFPAGPAAGNTDRGSKKHPRPAVSAAAGLFTDRRGHFSSYSAASAFSAAVFGAVRRTPAAALRLTRPAAGPPAYRSLFCAGNRGAW